MGSSTLISTLVFVLIVVLIAWAALYIIERSLPGDVQMPCKLIVGAIALIALLMRLLPLAGL
jgi:hypothetical protein